MFTATQYQMIKRQCLSDLKDLFAKLSIDFDWDSFDWEHNDEYKIYSQLNTRIDNSMCHFLKSSSIYAGYITLLYIGKIQYEQNETNEELLEKIVNNFQQICENNKIVCIPSIQKNTNQLQNIHIKWKMIKEYDNLGDLYDKMQNDIDVVCSKILALPSTKEKMQKQLTNYIDIFKRLQHYEHNEDYQETTFVEFSEQLNQNVGQKFVIIPVQSKNNQSALKPKTPSVQFTDNELQEIFDILQLLNKIVHAIE